MGKVFELLMKSVSVDKELLITVIDFDVKPKTSESTAADDTPDSVAKFDDCL